MPSRHKCFLLTPTDQIVVSLRRCALGAVQRCNRQQARYPGAEVITYEVHDVEVEIAREVGTIESSLDGDHTGHMIAHDDPRWPVICVCGYTFKIDDLWQENRTRLHARSDTGELVTIHDAPVGALYDSRSFNDIDGYQRNKSGMSLVCKTPAGEWLIDGPASNAPGWTRTGEPPEIDVTPSIGIGHPQRMHGWLRNGWLEIDTP